MATRDPSGARASIDAEQAWRTVLSIRDHPDPALPLALRLPGSDACLRVDTAGDWHCERPVSPAGAEVLDLYLPLCLAAGKPLVFAQMGQSLDGRIATVHGDSHYVTGPEDIVHLHRLRALADAVVIGAGTAVADDPRLTVRRTTGNNPVRVIVDPHARVPDDRTAFHDGQATTLLLRGDAGDADAPGMARCVQLPPDHTGKGVSPEHLLQLLAERGLRHVLIEGGGITVSRFIAAGLIDRLHVTVTPMIVGSGRPAFTLPVVDSLERALRPATRRFTLGDDVLFDLDLRHDRNGLPAS